MVIGPFAAGAVVMAIIASRGGPQLASSVPAVVKRVNSNPTAPQALKGRTSSAPGDSANVSGPPAATGRIYADSRTRSPASEVASHTAPAGGSPALADTPQAEPATRNAGSTPTPPADAGPEELLLEVHLNEQDMHQTTLFLRLADGRVLATGEDMQQWRLPPPPGAALAYDGSDFYPLDAIAGASYKIDTATQSIWITVPAAALSASVIDGFFPAGARPQPSPFGGFLNYSLFGTHTNSATVTNAYAELGLFDRWGIFTDSYLGNDLNGAAKQWVRLETVFTQDHPEDIATFKVGDTITNGGMTGLSVRFGGLQWGTNFSTRPGLAILPLPSIGGAAALPSTVQLYVNGVLRQSQDIQPGPFTIPVVPVSSGPGLVTLVIRDLSGHQQVISVPYYAAPSLLAKGLDDYSFSFGKERQNFAVASNDYGPTLGSVMFRHGFTDTFTGELRAEDTPGLQVFGAGGFFGLSTAGVLNLAVARSHSSILGDGTLSQIGYQYTGLVFGAGVNVQLASPRFTQPGYLPGQPAPRTQASASLSAFMGPAGSVSLGYVHQEDPLLGEIKLETLNYTKTFGDTGFLNFTLFHDLTGQNGNGAILSMTLPLGPQRSASFGVTHQSGSNTPFAEVQQSLPAGSGYGYRVVQQFGPNSSTDGEVDYQNNVGNYSLEALHSAGQTLYTGGMNGSIGFVGGDVFASRQLTDSFAVVDVPGQANVDIYAQNQVVSRTNGSGYAVIPRLNAYQNNTIGYDPRNLPLDTDITSATLNVVPYYRSGLLVQFPVKTVHGVTFTVKLKDGAPLPAGAQITVNGQGQPFPVGYDGEAYVTGLTGTARLQANWGDKVCEFSVTVPSNSPDPLPDLGTVVCEAIQP